MDLDHAMIDWAASLNLPMLLLLTKTDKLSRNEAQKQRLAVAKAAPDGALLTLFSALNAQGVEEAREQIERWFGERS